jgi:hypothetical protein
VRLENHPMTHTNCRVGAVEGTSFTECGFIIKNADNMPLVWLTYETEAKAKEAHRLIDKAIEGAVISVPVTGAERR